MILDALRRADRPDSAAGNLSADASASGKTQVFNSLLFISGLIAGVILAPLFWGLGSHNEINQKHQKISSVYGERSISNPLLGDLSADNPIDPRSPIVDIDPIFDTENDASKQATDGYQLFKADPIKPSSEAKEPANPAELERAEIVALNRAMWRDANEGLVTSNDASELQNDRAGPGLRSSGSVETISDSEAGRSIEMHEASAPIDLANVIQRAVVEMGEGALEPHPAVLLENLSQQFKNKLPTISYDSHDFSVDLEPSVTLNGVVLREGEKVGLFEVRDILRDSVILRFDDTDFRLKALNTWLNL